jgi:RNA polymerase-binding transcription factor DksA
MDLKSFKDKLLKEQKEIVKQLKELGEVPEFGTDIEGEVFEEEADEAEEYSKNLGIKQVLKERLLDIKNALDKIAKGDYGKCEECGNKIEPAILKISPESRFCKNCKA